MRVEADLDKCQGYVCCVMEAGDLFDIDEDGKVVVLVAEPSEGQRPTVESAVRQCPVSALTLIED
jgi:ferredoxin